MIIGLTFSKWFPFFFMEQEYTRCKSACLIEGSRRGMLPVNSLVTQKCTDFKNNISFAVIPSSYLKVMILKIPVGVKLQVEKLSL